MKILYAVSLFSGLENSVNNLVWEPTGAPTIYKMIEALDKGANDTIFAFVCKSAHLRGAFSKAAKIKIKGLRSPVWLLPYYKTPFIGKLGRLFRDFVHALFLLRLHIKNRFDLCYFNNGNLFIAALFAHAGVKPTVLRIMGAYPVMKRIVIRPGNLGERIERLAYKAPFSLAICSQDGSGGKWFMKHALRKNTPKITLINGVDWEEEGQADLGDLKKRFDFDKNLPVILFVGKMEEAKGCREFLEALLAVARERPGSFFGVMIGRGPQSEILEKMLSHSGSGRFIRIISLVPHSEMRLWHKMADVYVSLNKLGSLSNANLEAMRFGSAMIILESDRKKHVDEATDGLLPEGAVLRIGRQDIVGNLRAALKYFLDDPSEMRDRKRKVKAIAHDLIPTWEARIKEEMEILTCLHKTYPGFQEW